MTPHLPATIDSPAAWQIMREQGEMAVKSGLLPKAISTPEAAIIVMLKGRELGLPPMQALNSIVVIQGKPTISAEGMAALIFRDHGDNALKFIETSTTRATVRYQRKSWNEPQQFSFTMEDAKRAGVTNNPTWNKYPAAMLRARCISAVARLAFPDTIAGMYTPEELGSDPDESDLVILGPASSPEEATAAALPEPESPTEDGETEAAEETSAEEPTIAADAATGEILLRPTVEEVLPALQPWKKAFNLKSMTDAHRIAELLLERWDAQPTAEFLTIIADHAAAPLIDKIINENIEDVNALVTAYCDHNQLGDLERSALNDAVFDTMANMF